MTFKYPLFFWWPQVDGFWQFNFQCSSSQKLLAAGNLTLTLLGLKSDSFWQNHRKKKGKGQLYSPHIHTHTVDRLTTCLINFPTVHAYLHTYIYIDICLCICACIYICIYYTYILYAHIIHYYTYICIIYIMYVIYMIYI